MNVFAAHKPIQNRRHPVGFSLRIVALAAVLGLIWGPVFAADDEHGDDGDDGYKRAFCTKTAKAALRACRNEIRDDFWIAFGNCINVSKRVERRACKDEARTERLDGKEFCKEQFDARLELCDLLGEKRYDPDFDPINFDPHLTTPNPYFPLNVGDKWVYKGGDETITVEVLDKTKLIAGVTCRVVNDLVEEDGDVIEDTDDWYAQAWDSTVWYCGEIAKNFEVFDDDVPREAELVDIEGSWKAGRDGAKPGIIMKADPQPGNVYRQEVALGDAEDAAEVLSIAYSFGGETDDPESLDYLVPQELAEAVCNHDCLVTREFTPLEPDVEERKYYAPGIGLFLEVDLEAGETVHLVECTVNAVPCPIPTP